MPEYIATKVRTGKSGAGRGFVVEVRRSDRPNGVTAARLGGNRAERANWVLVTNWWPGRTHERLEFNLRKDWVSAQSEAAQRVSKGHPTDIVKIDE